MAVPPVVLILLAVWLRNRFDWGAWVIIAGVAVGLICAVNGLRNSLKAMERMAKDKKEDLPPPVSFNDHD